MSPAGAYSCNTKDPKCPKCGSTNLKIRVPEGKYFYIGYCLDCDWKDGEER